MFRLRDKGLRDQSHTTRFPANFRMTDYAGVEGGKHFANRRLVFISSIQRSVERGHPWRIVNIPAAGFSASFRPMRRRMLLACSALPVFSRFSSASHRFASIRTWEYPREHGTRYVLGLASFTCEFV